MLPGCGLPTCAACRIGFWTKGSLSAWQNILAQGRFDFLGIRGSPLLIGRLPLYLWLAAGAFKLFGTDILVLRSLTALCGVGVVGLSYLTARQALNRTAAFYTAALLAVLSEVVFLQRVGFSYNWLALLMVFFVFALWNYLEKGSAHAGGLCDGWSGQGEWPIRAVMGLAAVAALALVRSWFSGPASIWKLVVFGGLPVVCAVLPIFLAAPQDAWRDLLYSLGVGRSRGIGRNERWRRQLRPWPSW